MKRGMGVFALFAVLVAGARFAVTPSPSKTGSGAGSLLEPVPSRLELVDASCSEFSDTGDTNRSAAPGKVATLVDQYLHGVPGQAQPESASLSGKLPAGIRFMIATLPDPLHTHLNLQFD